MVLNAIGATAILVRVSLLAWLPVPQPWIHDEYSYLLAADTFVHGRLSNPTHPLSIFFDTFHVLQHPTYSSIYPPMQGAVLALGKLLGHPWIGVLLSTAAMCAAMTWMLQGWMPARWAFLGGVLVFLRFGIYTYWINSYWGGAVPATGAALIMGALPRIFKDWRLRDLIPLGFGTAILATSRPVEGFIYSVPVAAVFLWQYFRHRDSARGKSASQGLLAFLLLGACVVGLVLFCNWRVSRNPFVFPTSIEVREYVVSPVFIWQHAKTPPAYPNPQFDTFYKSSLPAEFSPGWRGIKTVTLTKIKTFWEFFLGPVLSIPFITLPWMFLDRKMRLVFAQFALSAAGLLVVVWFHPHYAAPLLVNVVLLMMQGLRHLRTWSILGRPIGLSLVRLIVLLSVMIVPVNLLFLHYPGLAAFWTAPGESLLPRYVVLLFVASLLLLLLRVRRRDEHQSSHQNRTVVPVLEFALLFLAASQISVGLRTKKPSELTSQFSRRSEIEERFNKLPGEHLVLVRYSPKHNVHEEFVYNDADIDRSKTVWAREIPGVDFQPLLTYFRNRDVWVLEPDADPIRLHPYPSGSSAASSFSPGNGTPSQLPK